MENTIAEQIRNVLRETHATTKEIGEELDIGENIIRVTINRMGKKGLAIHTGRFINRYKVYRLGRPEELVLGKKSEKYREILIKLILPFAQEGITVSTITSVETKIIEKLFKENYKKEGDDDS